MVSRRKFKDWFTLESLLKQFCLFCLAYFDVYLHGIFGLMLVKEPFSSDIGTLWNNYGEQTILRKLIETHSNLEDRIRKSNTVVDSWKKLLPFVEDDEKVATQSKTKFDFRIGNVPLFSNCCSFSR